MLDITNLPLTIPSTRNHLFLVNGTKIMLVIAGLSFISSRRNSFFLLQHIFKRNRVLLGVAGLPLTLPPNMNHLCLLHEDLSRARIIFGVTDALLTISSTRNNLYLLYGAFNWAMIILGVDNLPLTIPSNRNIYFPSMVCSTGSGLYWMKLTSR